MIEVLLWRSGHAPLASPSPSNTRNSQLNQDHQVNNDSNQWAFNMLADQYRGLWTEYINAEADRYRMQTPAEVQYSIERSGIQPFSSPCNYGNSAAPPSPLPGPSLLHSLRDPDR